MPPRQPRVLDQPGTPQPLVCASHRADLQKTFALPPGGAEACEGSSRDAAQPLRCSYRFRAGVWRAIAGPPWRHPLYRSEALGFSQLCVRANFEVLDLDVVEAAARLLGSGQILTTRIASQLRSGARPRIQKHLPVHAESRRAPPGTDLRIHASCAVRSAI